MNTQRVEGHTPLPWKSFYEGSGDYVIVGHEGTDVGSAWSKDAHFLGAGPKAAENEANAAFIVHAVNNIERLEKVNEALVESLAEAIKWIENAPEDAWGYANDDHARWPLRDELVSKLCKALAKEPA